MKKTLLFMVAIFAIGHAAAQNSVWHRISESQATTEKVARISHPTNYLLYSLDLGVLKSKLQAAPSRYSRQQSPVIVSFPTPNGELQDFRIYEASVMDPELAARHPEIQSYVGQGIDDRSATIRFSITLFGLHTMTFSGINGTSYIDPYTKDSKNYMVYNRSELVSPNHHICNFVDDPNRHALDNPENDLILNRSNNSLFKNYRLAMSCTIEYAAYHVAAAGVGGGTLAQKKAAVLAAMVVTMTRVNGVYERDLAVTMTLIANNEALINITSDSYDNDNTNNILLSQNQTQVDLIIGSANYDIGHVVSTGGGGVASLGCVCTSIKAQGVTGLPAPVGDAYDIDFVAHEMGHQFGGNHTFNSDQSNCGGGNRSTSSAFEPGSGTTIMAYAGICAPDDVQLHSDAYFHARSLIQIQSLINGTANCAVATPNGNTPPSVSAGTNKTIPLNTPFVLRGVATDVDNPVLTYCWEQYNAQISEQPPLPTSATGPNFRSYEPTTSPDRYFPKLSDVLAGNLTPTWEVIPTVARTMIFSLVVRDNQTPLGGQTERATMTMTFAANTGPFRVTSQSTPVAWLQGSTQTVTWDVAGTDANGINAALVNIKMSIDGGLTFPYTLATNTPNDGSESVIAPNAVSLTCRIMVEAAGNVFYALNTSPFYLGYNVQNVCNTYTYSVPFALPDAATSYTVKSINVPVSGAGAISDVNIHIDATHPNLQNLVMAFVRPGGSGLTTLFSQQCSGNADMSVTFDAQGSPFTCASPATGTYIPPSGYNLNLLNGLNPVGNWQFGFKDVVAGSAGTINSITLEVCNQIITLATNDFEFQNFALYPNPNNGNFTVQFDAQSGSKINIAVHDIRGRKIFDKVYNNTGLFSENLQLEHAQSGVYLVSITDGTHKAVKRIVKQ
jgi:subtilisin-like proprotein convertase family protein